MSHVKQPQQVVLMGDEGLSREIMCHLATADVMVIRDLWTYAICLCVKKKKGKMARP